MSPKVEASALPHLKIPGSLSPSTFPIRLSDTPYPSSQTQAIMPDIIHCIPIKASPKAIFDALTTQKGLSSWWTEHVMAEPTEGSTTTFGFNGGEIEFHMHIDELEPSERVRWTCTSDFPDWNGTTLRFDISVRDDGVAMVDFRHMNFPEGDHFARCNTDWGRLMYFLKDYLENGNDTPMMR